MKNILFLFLIISFGTYAQKDGIQFEKLSWNQIIQKAKAENKLIFMDAYTTWCGPCKAMTANVFPDAKLGAFFNKNYINAKIDMEEGEGPMIANKYPLRGYPTLFFIDPFSEKVINQVLGSRTIEQLLDIGVQTLPKKAMK